MPDLTPVLLLGALMVALVLAAALARGADR